MKMKHHHIYVVEVSFRPNNPVHRQIAMCIHEGTQTMSFLTTDERLTRTPEKLYHFKVISEIEDMNPNKRWEKEES